MKGVILYTIWVLLFIFAVAVLTLILIYFIDNIILKKFKLEFDFGLIVLVSILISLLVVLTVTYHLV